MALRRRAGVRTWEAALECPVISRSVRMAVLASSSMKPSDAIESAKSRPVISAAAATRLRRLSVPRAAAVTVTAMPRSRSAAIPPAALASSPRYSSGGTAASRACPPAEPSTPKLDKSQHDLWVSRRALCTSSKSMKLDLSKLMGAPAPWPPAAACQPAAMNSSAVFARSCAARFSLSTSLNIMTASRGNSEYTGIMSSISAGISDSIPSTGTPRAIDSSMSSALGIEPASASALRRTLSVSCSSRQAGAHIWCIFSPNVRWSEAWKACMLSMSSPKKSMRTGCAAVGGKISRMPPRTANSPRSITRSVRV